jgi:hypothetical protein
MRRRAYLWVALVAVPALLAHPGSADAQSGIPEGEVPPAPDQVALAPPEVAPAPAPAPLPPLITPPPYVPPDPRRGFDMGFDIGAGLLEFFHLDVSVLVTRQWAVGLGVGGFPIDKALSMVMGVDDLSASAQMAGIELQGDVETKLGSGRIFGRWFPWKKLFLLELTVEAWRLEVAATGRVTDVETEVEYVDVEVAARVWVPMIGVHGGWRFLWKNGAYLEIVGGLNVLLSPGAEVEFGGDTIEDLQEYPMAAAALESAQDFLGDKLQEGANSITKKIKAFPTGALRFGWAFDFW